jgi:hypothetical protein
MLNSINEPTEITIANINGELVLSQKVKKSVKLDVSELTTGTYFIIVTNNER